MNSPNQALDPSRFERLWRGCAQVAATQDTAEIFATLRTLYAEPHRHYHTAAHICECLARMDFARAELGEVAGVDWAEVELALWFHDAIYQSGNPANERESADFFLARARGNLPAETCAAVESHIMDTRHRAPAQSSGGQLVADIDLSGMGMAAQSFQRDGRNIRREFSHLSDPDYARGQWGFLQNLLARERIFGSDFFHAKFETQARQNIQNAEAHYREMMAGGE